MKVIQSRASAGTAWTRARRRDDAPMPLDLTDAEIATAATA
jgi:hypothetical protein